MCWWWRYHPAWAERGHAPFILFVCQDEDQRDVFMGAADRELSRHVWYPSVGAEQHVYVGRRRVLFACEIDLHARRLDTWRLPSFPPGPPAPARPRGRGTCGAPAATARYAGDGEQDLGGPKHLMRICRASSPAPGGRPFGLLLIFTAVQLFRHRDQDPEIEDNALVKATRRVLPVTDAYDGGRLVTRVDGRRAATPLFVVFVALGSTDILFALDSIPAVFGVTEEAFIVFAANAFALLGLRALYFLVTGLLDRLVYLSTGLSLILAFIGVKLMLHYGHLQDDDIPEIATSTSLLVITVVLVITVIASVLKARRDPEARAHPGSLRDTRDRNAHSSTSTAPRA